MIEKVNPSHPDKVADRIAGAIVSFVVKAVSDTQRYKALGNSFAIPNALFVISRCVKQLQD